MRSTVGDVSMELDTLECFVLLLHDYSLGNPFQL
jgi:hypothetical protein